jgi:hypothetical protein
MVFTNFEEFLGITLDTPLLEQWSNDLKLNELLEEINEEEEEDEEDEEDEE